MITIVEPHGDDALISCFPILQKDEPINVITLGNSRPSTGLEKHFKNVSTTYLDLYQISYFLVKPTYRDYVAWLKSPLTKPSSAWDWQYHHVRNQAAELWTESHDILVEAYNDLNFPSHSTVYLPLGLLHPYHILVSAVADRFRYYRPDVRFIYYSEAPYNSHKWARAIEAERPKGKLSQAVTATEEEYKFKEAVFRDVYPTEVKMYFAYSYDQVIKNEYRFYETLNS